MSLLRSICWPSSVVDAPGKNLSRLQRPCEVKRLVILAKGKLSQERASEDELRHMEGGATSTPRRGRPH
jgi:hypothetical protein